MNDLEQRYEENQSKKNVRFLVIVMVILSILIVVAAGFILSSELSKLSKEIDTQNKLIESQSQDKTLEALNQSNELIVCALAFHIGPDKVREILPNLNIEKCSQILLQASNGDGSFFSNEIDKQLTPTQGPTGNTGATGKQGEQGPSGSQQNPGPIQGIIDGLDGVIGGIL